MARNDSHLTKQAPLGPLADAIDEAMELSRSIWRLVFDEQIGKAEDDYISFFAKDFETWNSSNSPGSIRSRLLEHLRFLNWISEHDEVVKVRLDVLRPQKFIETSLRFGRR